MSDISKINVNNIEYNLKDSQARTEISQTKTEINSFTSSLGELAFKDDVLSKDSNPNKKWIRQNNDWLEYTESSGGEVATVGDQIIVNDTLGELQFNSGDLQVEDVIARDFTTTFSYNVGDLVIYDHKLYRFTQAHPAGPWDSTHVVESNASESLNLINSTRAVYYGVGNVGPYSVRFPSTGTNGKINSNMRIVDYDFSISDNVISDIDWTTNAGYITFGTTTDYSGTTSINFYLVETIGL